MTAAGNRPGQVTVATWLDEDHVGWSFGHARELMPTQQVRRSPAPRPLPVGEPRELDQVPFVRADGRASTVGDQLAESSTDGWLVVQDGHVATERYGRHLRPEQPHLLMSVTKSVIGCLAGVLVGRGRLDPAAPVVDVVPELAGSGYDGATVRHVLDMRSGVRFREDYTDPGSDIRAMDRWVGWRPSSTDEPRRGLYAFLRTLTADVAHGGTFGYRSCETDVLGWVCERAAGQRMADLLTELLWQPMGAVDDADLMCDGVGTALHDGGLSATLRDLGRFGLLLLDDGRAGTGDTASQVVPAQWLAQARAVDTDLRQAFAASLAEQVFPGGWYRNQLWFRPGRFGDVVLALGIHGQLVHVCRRTRTVCVKLSSWPQPQQPGVLLDTVRACDAVGGHLAGLADDARAATGPAGVVFGGGRRLASRDRSHGGTP